MLWIESRAVAYDRYRCRGVVTARGGETDVEETDDG